jgi:hypothetical protein
VQFVVVSVIAVTRTSEELSDLLESTYKYQGGGERTVAKLMPSIVHSFSQNFFNASFK